MSRPRFLQNLNLCLFFFNLKQVQIKNTLELSNGALLGETKLNHVNSKATRVYSFVEKTNI